MKQLSNLAIVGIDVETTALDPREGEIIEVAAVRYQFSKTQSTKPKQSPKTQFVKLCKPSRPISDEITALTGITNDMVADAPTFAEILEELQEFIGDSLIFAHNASFDVKWLSYHGLNLANNKVWDTFMIASVAWPEAESYNLAALVNAQITKHKGQTKQKTSWPKGRGEHSAEYDVEMAWRVLQATQRELVARPEVYRQIVELLERTGLSHYIPLFERGVSSPYLSAASLLTDPLSSPDGEGLPLSKGEKGSVAFSLGPDGLLAKHFEGFAQRPEQQRMAAEVESSLEEGGVSLIEAPTGIGKTVGYLTPVLLKLKEHRTSPSAIISTYTKHLQDQLLNQDLPALQAALGTKYAASVLKGRRNYLCSRRLGAAFEREKLQPGDAWLLIKARLWLDRNGNGDLDRLNFSHQGEGIVGSLHADSLVCRQGCGRDLESVCPYQVAVRRAREAQVLIVNHSLLADPSFLKRWQCYALIVDEAHHFEEATRRATRVALSSGRLQEILGPLLQDGRPAFAPAYGGAPAGKHLHLEANELLADYRTLLDSIKAFADTHTQRSSLRLTSLIRQSSGWGKIERVARRWHARASFIIGLIEGMPAAQKSDPRPARLALEMADVMSGLRQFSHDLSRFVTGDRTRIQWIDWPPTGAIARRGSDGVYLNDVALFIAPMINHLCENIRSIVFTSATLTTAGNFTYVKEMLGISSARELVLPSSFALAENLLIYVVDDAPDPRSAAFDEFVANYLVDIARLLHGRTLGLFTSLASVKSVFQRLTRPLNKAAIKLYAQGMTGGKSAMIRRFRDVPGSVLLGTDSFWEGIDIPGDTLSCVAIAKLPFVRPADPIIEAVAEARGVDSFLQVSLPRMILKLKQGIGRLIRRDDDRGIVIIFDSRAARSGYADDVIKSLPPGRIKIGPAKEVAGVIKNWIGEEFINSW